MDTRRRILQYLTFLALIASATASLVGQEVDQPSAPRVDILFIGNSYTYYNNLPGILHSIAAARLDLNLHIATVVEGGASLRSHWNESTVELIRRGGWDYVVLQEQSLAPLEAPDQFTLYGKRFANEIRGANARPVLYLTWSREQRPEDQVRLNEAYLELARETQAMIVPVGPVWQELRATEGMPDLYAEDGSHPSPFGSFVAAITFYRVILRDMPPDTSGLTHGVHRHTMRLVQNAVEDAIKSHTAR